jgi:hypothetical protein
MPKKLIILFFSTVLLSACNNSDTTQNEPQKAQINVIQKDEVPAIEIKDVNGIKTVFINGKNISAREFIDKYCFGKNANETCNKVSLVAQLNSTSGGTMPKGW